MEKFSVIDILTTSFKFSLVQKRFFLFGFLMTLPAVILTFFLQQNTVETPGELLSILLTHPLGCVLFVVGYLFFQLIGKGSLISLFHASFEKKQASSTPSSLVTSFWKALRIDAVLFSFFASILFIIALPTLLSFWLEHDASESLLFLTELTLIPILFIGYFIREFTYCYFLLSPLTLRDSFEASSNLFIRNRYNCLSFGIAFLCIALLFTFFLNFVMLSIVALLQNVSFFSEQGIFLVASLIFVTWYEVWRQSFWFHFFQTLAKPKSPSADEPVTVPLEKKIPEISGV